MTKTGEVAVRNTASATEPTNNLPMGPGECVPITIRSIWRSRVKARISSAGNPGCATTSHDEARFTDADGEGLGDAAFPIRAAAA